MEQFWNRELFSENDVATMFLKKFAFLISGAKSRQWVHQNLTNWPTNQQGKWWPDWTDNSGRVNDFHINYWKYNKNFLCDAGSAWETDY